jgi:hypothetical protein
MGRKKNKRKNKSRQEKNKIKEILAKQEEIMSKQNLLPFSENLISSKNLFIDLNKRLSKRKQKQLPKPKQINLLGKREADEDSVNSEHKDKV